MRTAVNFRLIGAEAMSTAVRQFSARYRQRVAAALKFEADAIMQDSQDNYVPLADGDLKDSGKVGRVDVTPDRISVDLSYGGPGSPAAAYAVAVHEHPSAASPRTWRNVRDRATGRFRRVQFKPAGHGPKYLELPLRAASSTVMGSIGNKTRF